jgi:CDP-diacylglycerol--serine O-phosphatidyltransferase
MANPSEFKPRGIYLLPNLLTTAALFAGFYAIVATLKDRLDTAAIAIFIAMIADSLDGRVARLTNTQTAFGAEYDSLSDMVSFGIAPALLAFNWGLSTLGNIGWLVVFLYTAATALRLARFNTQLGIIDKRFFQGLPSPAAAASVASFVWVMVDNAWESTRWLVILFAILVIFCAALMVSRIRFNSFKQFNWQGRVPFVSLLLLVLIFAFIFWDPPEVLFLVSIIFAFSGPVLTLWSLRRKRRARKLR